MGRFNVNLIGGGTKHMQVPIELNYSGPMAITLNNDVKHNKL